MQGFYINLDRASERRQQIERHLVDLNVIEQYRRLLAVDGREIEVPPRCRILPTELGCWRSHEEAWRRSLGATGPVHVLEDDAIVSPTFYSVADHLLRDLDKREWDLWFTDIFAGDLNVATFIGRSAEEARRRGGFTMLSLGALLFAGASSYVMHPNAPQKMLDLLASREAADLPMDLALRNLSKVGITEMLR